MLTNIAFDMFENNCGVNRFLPLVKKYNMCFSIIEVDYTKNTVFIHARE